MKSIVSIIVGLLLIACGDQTTRNHITEKEDYNRYLSTKPVATSSKYFELWNSKIKPDSTQLLSFGIVAGEYSRFFQNTGEISYLKRAEQALKKAINVAAIDRQVYYRALARNYISQHRFMEALQMADSALAIGGGLKASQSLLFDVHMELGNYNLAKSYLDSISNFSEFSFLIRLAKWNDHLGDLDATIRFMKKAEKMALRSNNESLISWVYTNLADYYGHAGQIKQSYDYYLKALQLNSNNAYAKKGLAWIVYSCERDPKEALRILDSVTSYHKSPDYLLLKAEIAQFLKDETAQRSNMNAFWKEIENSSYGTMYNVHAIDLYLEETHDYAKAIVLAQNEIQNRATPENYGLLAYSYFKNDESDKAVKLLQDHVDGKTFEPEILLKAAEIYNAAGEAEKATSLKEELLGAKYELGPLAERRISAL